MKVQTSETAVLVVFAVTLIGCILAGIPILAALALGYLIFFAYTLSRGYTVRDILGMSWKGIKTAKNILITFLLIGMLTALWRAAGISKKDSGKDRSACEDFIASHRLRHGHADHAHGRRRSECCSCKDGHQTV